MEADISNKEKEKDDKKSSKPRCRMKKLLNSVQELLDFYFSDVNLNHDRFLRKEIENSTEGYVELSIMLNFNKLKQLTTDTTLLAKAVGNSSTLQLSEDSQKLRRKEKLQELRNTDTRTVYVEEFPPQADHDWLKAVFSTCGKVEYISLPKFKHKNQLKGFAFIEFSSPEEAQKACQELNTIRCRNRKRLSTECRYSEDESAKKKNNRKRRSTSECDPNNTPNQLNARRRRSISESSEGSPAKLIKRKRRSSLSSTEELDESKQKVEKTEVNTKSDVFITSPKKQRSKENSISSDGENTTVNIKNEPKTFFQKPNSVSTGLQRPEVTKTTTSIRRKRKSSSEVKELEINKAKLLKEPKCDKEIKSITNSETSKDTRSFNSELSVKLECNVDMKSKVDSHASNVPVRDSDPLKVNSCDNTKGELGDCDDKTLSENSDQVSIKVGQSDSSNNKQVKESKRKISSTSEHEENVSPLKKVKVDESCGDVKSSKKTDNETIKEEEMVKKKKNRQHKKKEKKGEKVPDAISVPPLHVISKGEWLTLKKEYKRLQQIKMSELKRNLKVLKSEQVRRSELKGRIIETISAKHELQDIKSGEDNMNEETKPAIDEEKENHYSKLMIKESEEKNVVKSVDTKPKGLNMLPGTVVGLKTSSENLTRKDVKSALVSFGKVVYVDYVDGVYQGFIRFASPDDVENVMSANPVDKQSWPFQLRTLSNEEENDYFRKAEEDRLKKYNKDQRKKRKKGRGVDKITRDVETVSNHVHFT